MSILGQETINIRLAGTDVPVDRSVFTALFEESVVSTRAPYVRALGSSTIEFEDLVKLSRDAQIPYVLFFAQPALVREQIKKKRQALLAGVSKNVFSMNARSTVKLRDVELIVKDILHKQELLKKLDPSLVKNALVGSLRGSRRPLPEDARLFRTTFGIAADELRSTRTKEQALDLLIRKLELKQVYVSQSQNFYMPQLLPRGVKFSGMCVRDQKIPFIFLTGGDGGDNPEPAGRKVFTLVLLAVCVAQGRFAPVTYDDQTGDLITDRSYALAEEILMPADEAGALEVSTLDAVRTYADTFRVTPSAFVMRSRRLGVVSPEQADGYLSELHAEFTRRKKPVMRPPKPVTAIRKYNGREYTSRMLAQLDRGAIRPAEFCRVVCLNKIGPPQIGDLRAAL